MSSHDEGSATGARETGLFTSLSLVMLVVFFAGCACFTLAEVLLGSNDKASAVLAIVGVPLFLIGGIVLVRRARLGPAPLPPVPSSSGDNARR